MLKAYDYVEYSPDSSSLQNPQYFERELEIAQDIVKQIYKRKRKPVAVRRVAVAGSHISVINGK